MQYFKIIVSFFKTEIKPIHQIIDVTSDCVYMGPIYICTPISDMDLSRD